MEDNYRHKGLRKKLVEELRSKGISDEEVLSAINNIPRHLFMDNAFVHFAYKNAAFPIGANQTISHPMTVAVQSELLEVASKDKILEIGTGSGYQCCVLMELGAKVYSIERHRSLHQKAKQIIESFGYKPKLFFGDGYKGLPAYAPFDKIIITAAAPFIPEELKQQLRTGGHMIIPLGEGEKQEMLKITKVAEEKYETKSYGDFSFVPMLEKKSFNT